MIETYKEKDDLWFLYGQATTAITDYIFDNEQVDSEHGWRFREGTVRKSIGKNSGYIVSIFYTAFDNTKHKQLFLSVQANVSNNGQISVCTVKRCELDESIEKLL